MRKIKDSTSPDNGDWILMRKPPYPKKDKRHVIIIVKSNTLTIYSFDYKGIMRKIEASRSILEDTLNFYPRHYENYTLNKKEKIRFNREIILGSLE